MTVEKQEYNTSENICAIKQVNIFRKIGQKLF